MFTLKHQIKSTYKNATLFAILEQNKNFKKEVSNFKKQRQFV